CATTLVPEPEPADQSKGRAPFESRFFGPSAKIAAFDLDRPRTRVIHLCGSSWLVGARDAAQIEASLLSFLKERGRSSPLCFVVCLSVAVVRRCLGAPL
ncbi:MAG TPA: hypothetical protein VNB91_08250, partial [Jatrophihabitantaceae bacterium]|nr:hypothetical protein [Jatrophihabitantaceae bacterium]